MSVTKSFVWTGVLSLLASPVLAHANFDNSSKKSDAIAASADGAQTPQATPVPAKQDVLSARTADQGPDQNWEQDAIQNILEACLGDGNTKAACDSAVNRLTPQQRLIIIKDVNAWLKELQSGKLQKEPLRKFRAWLDHAVAEGLITQAEADQAYAQASAKIDAKSQQMAALMKATVAILKTAR